MKKLDSDKKWGQFNKELEKFMKLNDFFALGTTYYKMVNFLQRENKNSDHLRKLGYEMKLLFNNNELQRLKKSGVVKEVKILCNQKDSCEVCKKQNGKNFSIEKAVFQKPIPVENCTNKYGCRCCYLPKVM
jgi:hypothetical protein